MADGIECRCATHSESECGCGVDWTPKELIEVRAELTRLRTELAEANRHAKVLAESAGFWKVDAQVCSAEELNNAILYAKGLP